MRPTTWYIVLLICNNFVRATIEHAGVFSVVWWMRSLCPKQKEDGCTIECTWFVLCPFIHTRFLVFVWNNVLSLSIYHFLKHRAWKVWCALISAIIAWLSRFLSFFTNGNRMWWWWTRFTACYSIGAFSGDYAPLSLCQSHQKFKFIWAFACVVLNSHPASRNVPSSPNFTIRTRLLYDQAMVGIRWVQSTCMIEVRLFANASACLQN